ncbi:MAG TPA: hypothetical protein PKN87_09305 [Syntrophomonadaceae bacterium]|nr:hypothetical protein [Syntrophomonadaceae bacterium]
MFKLKKMKFLTIFLAVLLLFCASLAAPVNNLTSGITALAEEDLSAYTSAGGVTPEAYPWSSGSNTNPCDFYGIDPTDISHVWDKVDSPVGGITDNSVNYSVSGNTLEWSYDSGDYYVHAVWMKAGSDYNYLYLYDEDTQSDSGLYAAEGKDISHVIFCLLPLSDPEPDNGTLIINKVLAGNDQPADGTEFTVTIGDTAETITAGENSFSLAPGTYAITETDSQGADSVAYSTQSAVIAENDTTTVTITNTFNTDPGGGDPEPGGNGILIINKVLAGNDQPADGTEFTVTIGDTAETIIAGENSFSLAPGTYAITETDSQGADSVAYSTQSAVIAENDTATVTITNTFNTDTGGGDPEPDDGILIVSKVLTGNNRPDRDTEFTITINGEEHSIIAGDNSFTLEPGTYTVIETRDRGATSVRNRTQSAVVKADETTVITITNVFSRGGGDNGGGDYTPPEKTDDPAGPDEPITITEPPVAAPAAADVEVPVASTPVEETINVPEEMPAAKPLPYTGGPVLIYLGAGLGLCGVGLTIRKRFM